MNHLKTAGFNLIEMIVVIAVISILAFIAIPAYQDYLIRAKVSELLTAAAPAKVGVSEYYITHGTLPNNNDQAGIASVVTQYVSGIKIGANGIVTITGNEKALGTTGPLAILFTPIPAQGALKWTCSAKGATQFVPASCREIKEKKSN